MYFLLSNFFELASLVASLFFLSSLKRQGWLILIPYLLYTCLTDGLAAYYKYVLHEKNVWLYNPYIIISFAFYGWLLVYSMHKWKLKKWLFLMVSIFSVGAMIWYLFFGNPKTFISSILTAGSFFIIGLVLIFFYNKLQMIEHDKIITNDPSFWIATGLLFFYTGISLSNAMYSYLSIVKVKFFNVALHNLIPQFLSVILYTCIIIAIIKCRSRTKISST